MKIAVLGGQGFVGSSLVKFLSAKHTVIPVTRNTLDLLDDNQVADFLCKHNFDVVINAAATMKDNTLVDDTRNNLGLFMLFHRHRNLFGKLINLASGAEYDRRYPITNASENSIFTILPADSYGFGQNIKSRICAETLNFYNIRIFNCFGSGEIKTRIFPRFLSEGSVTIKDDRYFDYFSIQDLCTVVLDCVEHTWFIKDVNAVYKQKYLISEALRLFAELNHLKPDFTIVNTSENNYTGDGNKLQSLGLVLQGLHAGFANYQQGI